MECWKCPLNGKGDERCIQCCQNHQEQREDYSHNLYILDTYDPPDPNTLKNDDEEEIKVTDLNENEEDNLRKLLFTIFDLSPLELLCLQSIMRRMTLQQFADSMTDLLKTQNAQMEKNAEGKFTRHHAFQIRKAILKKHKDLKFGLETVGQRKQLKED